MRKMRIFFRRMRMADVFRIIDGGMGRELLRKGAPFTQPEWSALALMQAPEMVKAVHEDFIAAGAEVITTNTYALVPFHIGEERFFAQGETLAALAGRLAREAADAADNVWVAGSLPPLFGSYRPDWFDANRAPELGLPLIRAQAPFVDVWLMETQSSLAEVLAWLALLPADGKPRWVSVTLEDEREVREPCLRSGESVAEVVKALCAEGSAEAILFNCSLPEVMAAAIKVARTTLNTQEKSWHVGVYANAFVAHEADEALPANDGLDAVREDLSPAAYVDFARCWLAAGADMVGGCCGITPAHIAALHDAFRK